MVTAASHYRWGVCSIDRRRRKTTTTTTTTHKKKGGVFIVFFFSFFLLIFFLSITLHLSSSGSLLLWYPAMSAILPHLHASQLSQPGFRSLHPSRLQPLPPSCPPIYVHFDHNPTSSFHPPLSIGASAPPHPCLPEKRKESSHPAFLPPSSLFSIYLCSALWACRYV